MSVRFFGLIPRLPSLAKEEFHDHYRHPHGTHGLDNPGVQVYVQSHRIHTDFLGGGQERYDAIAEVIFGSIEEGLGLATAENYLKYLKPDEEYFVDMPRLKWLYTRNVIDEWRTPVTPAEERWDMARVPTSIKLLQFLSEEDAVSTLDVDDAALAAQLNANRFVRSVPIDEVYQDEAPSYAAVRELWWPTLHEANQAIRDDFEAWQALTKLSDDSTTLLARAERFR